MKKFFIVIFAAMFFMSCTSLKKEKIEIRGSVCDTNGSPINLAEIFFNNKLVAYTNLNGQFFAYVELAEKNFLEVRKINYEKKFLNLNFENTGKYFFIKLKNYNEIFSETENLLDAAKYKNAAQKIDSLYVFGSELDKINFVKAFCYAKDSQFESSQKIIDELKNKNPEDKNLILLEQFLAKSMEKK